MLSDRSAKRRIGGAISRGKTATPAGTSEKAGGPQLAGDFRRWYPGFSQVPARRSMTAYQAVSVPARSTSAGCVAPGS